MPCRPTASCRLIAWRMASSTKRRSFRLRASSSPAGRSRLPTWSARKGGVIPRCYYLEAGPEVGDAILGRAQGTVGPVVARQPALFRHAGGELVARAGFRHRRGLPGEVGDPDDAFLLQGEVLSEPVAQRGVPRGVPDVDALVGVPEREHPLLVGGFPNGLGVQLPLQAGDRHSPDVALAVPEV